jgi:hypothetical protein
MIAAKSTWGQRVSSGERRRPFGQTGSTYHYIASVLHISSVLHIASKCYANDITMLYRNINNGDRFCMVRRKV